MELIELLFDWIIYTLFNNSFIRCSLHCTFNFFYMVCLSVIPFFIILQSMYKAETGDVLWSYTFSNS